jgi:hypothetical protein
VVRDPIHCTHYEKYKTVSIEEENTYRAYSALDRGPSRPTIWPPAWLTAPEPASSEAAAELAEELPDIQSEPPASPTAARSPHEVPAGRNLVEQRVAYGPICRCGSRHTTDTPIHGGRDLRRDCARCRCFISFPTWNGIPA